MRHTRLPSGASRAYGFRGDRADPLLVPPIRLTFGAVLAINAGRLLILLARGVRRHPRGFLTVAALLTVWALLGSTRLLIALAGVGIALTLWFLVHEASLETGRDACVVTSRTGTRSIGGAHTCAASMARRQGTVGRSDCAPRAKLQGRHDGFLLPPVAMQRRPSDPRR